MCAVLARRFAFLFVRSLSRKMQARSARPSRPLLGLCAALLAARFCTVELELFVSPQASETSRRQALVASGLLAATQGAPAQAFQKFETDKTELVQAPANEKSGVPGYLFQKPAGFKRLANVIDPTGFVFRNKEDTYFTFATRAEARPNASIEFTPDDFINDYRSNLAKKNHGHPWRSW
eukprot:Skav210573  [mRNA]  locus=scaffold2317:168582:171516:+ [translate_table: standard]